MEKFNRSLTAGAIFGLSFGTLDLLLPLISKRFEKILTSMLFEATVITIIAFVFGTISYNLIIGKREKTSVSGCVLSGGLTGVLTFTVGNYVAMRLMTVHSSGDWLSEWSIFVITMLTTTLLYGIVAGPVGCLIGYFFSQYRLFNKKGILSLAIMMLLVIIANIIYGQEIGGGG